jgi:tetratricopeptide (TPR) repeat protein
MSMLRLKIVGKLVISVALSMTVSSCYPEQKSEPKSRSIDVSSSQNTANTQEQKSEQKSRSVSISPNHSNIQQQKRIALVIGNANYQVGKLDTPLNDATDMAAALNELGFEVILLKDSSKREMDEALDQFLTRIKQGYVGLFYYAGHGMQVEGENYLIPVNAQIKAETDVKYESVSLGKILDRMEEAKNQIKIVILDACRDNPFRSFSRSSSRGLTTPVQPASGTLIVFATAPGKVASDGGIGRNGLFTSYLLKYIKTPNLDVDLMLRQVRSDVAKNNNDQVPWNSSSLTGEFFFNKKPETINSTAISSPVPFPSSTPVTISTPKPSPSTTLSTPQPQPSPSSPQPQPSPSSQLTAKAFYDSGNSKYELKDYKGAIADYDQSITLKPDYAEAYNNRGMSKFSLVYNLLISEYETVYYQGSIADYNQAIALKPDYAEAYYNRGLSYKYLGYNSRYFNDFHYAVELYQQQNNQTGYQASLKELNDQIVPYKTNGVISIPLMGRQAYIP